MKIDTYSHDVWLWCWWWLMRIMMVNRCEKQEGLLCEHHKGSLLWNKVMFDYNALSDQVVTKTVNIRVDESVSYDRQVTLATLAKVWLHYDTNYDDDDNDNNNDDDFTLCSGVGHLLCGSEAKVTKTNQFLSSTFYITTHRQNYCCLFCFCLIVCS